MNLPFITKGYLFRVFDPIDTVGVFTSPKCCSQLKRDPLKTYLNPCINELRKHTTLEDNKTWLRLDSVKKIPSLG